MTDRALTVGIALKATDLSGVKAVENLTQNVDKAADAIESVKKQGGLQGIVAAAEEKRVAGLVGEILRLQSALDKTGASLKGIDPSDSAFAVLTGQANDLTDAIKRANSEIEKTPTRLSSGGARGLSETGERGLLAIAGAASSFGASGAAGGLAAGADVLGLVEPLKILGGTLAETEGIVGRVASAGASLLAPLGATAAGLGSVLAVAAPVGIAVGGLALIFANAQARAEAARQATLEGLDAQERYFAIIATGSKEAAEQAIQTEQKNLVAARGHRDVLESVIEKLHEIDAIRAEAAAGGGAAPDFLFPRIGELQEQIADQLQQMGFDISKGVNFDEVVKEYEDLGLQVTSSTTLVDQLTVALHDGSLAAEDAAVSADKLNAALTSLAQIEDERARTIAQFDQQNGDTLSDRLRRNQREQEEFDIARERRINTHNDRITAIETESAARVAAIQEQGLKRIQQFDEQTARVQQQITDLATKLRDDRARIDKQYMDSERKAFEKFRVDEVRASDQANRDRLRKIEDINNQLRDAEEANDVVRFIQAKRAGEQELKRMSEDTDTTAKIRTEQFLEERQAAEEAREARLQELQDAAEARRADLAAQLEERAAARDELVAEIQAQKEAEIERIKATVEAQKLAFAENERLIDDDRKRRQKNQTEDERIADDRRKRALDQALSDLDTRAAKERAVVQGTAQILENEFSSAARAISSVVAQMMSSIRSAAASASYGSSGYGSGSGGSNSPLSRGPGRTITAFANEGVVDRPTLAVLGDKLLPGEREAVMRIRPSEGLPQGFGRGGGPSIQLSIGSVSIGANLTREDVEGVGMEIAAGLLEGMSRGRSSTGIGVEIEVR